MSSPFERAKKRIKKMLASKKAADANAEALKMKPDAVIAGFTAALKANGESELVILQGSSAFQLLALLGMATMRLQESIRASDQAQMDAAASARAAEAAAAQAPPAAPAPPVKGVSNVTPLRPPANDPADEQPAATAPQPA